MRMGRTERMWNICSEDSKDGEDNVDVEDCEDVEDSEDDLEDTEDVDDSSMWRKMWMWWTVRMWRVARRTKGIDKNVLTRGWKMHLSEHEECIQVSK